MLESEQEADMEFGYLVVFRKGQISAPYELDEGDHSIGSSRECNIRLKFSHPLLLQIHALIRVNEDGVATILNKSVGAPVKVNEKIALRPTILKHEDKFEILNKVFQYFNHHLKHEPEDSQKFVKGKIGSLNNGRRSVHPLTAPAKKSPNLKTKILSVRKSTSAMPKGLQVIITPNNKKPDSHIGSKTTSKIVVSKALASPCNAKKRRLSLDNPHKVSQTPKILSRNILLSKSTINITISEEHEYSEFAPSTSNRTVQDEAENLKAGTPRRSVKVENGNTPNNEISVDLIDLNSPTPVRKSAVRQSTLKALNEEPTENRGSINVMKTPVNKRIQSLKTVRHSLKKDTPPPRFALPKVIIQQPTPLKNVEGTTLNKSSLDDCVKSLVKSPENSLGTFRNSSRSAENALDPANSKSSRISRNLSRRSSKLEVPINSRTEDDTTDKDDNTIKSSRISNNASRRSRRIETPTSSFQTDDAEDNVTRSSRISRSLKVDAPVRYHIEDNTTYEENNVNKSYRDSRNTPKQNTKIKVSADTTQIEDNEDDNINKSTRVSINASRRSRKIEESSKSEDNILDEDNVNNSSRASMSTSRRSTRIKVTADNIDTGDINKSSNVSTNSSERSRMITGPTVSSQTEDNATNAEDDTTDGEDSIMSSLRVSAPFNSQTETDTTDEDNVNKSSRGLRNTSRRSTKTSANTTQEDSIDATDNINKSSKVSINTSRRSIKIEATTGSSQTEDNATNAEDDTADGEDRNSMSSRFSRSLRVSAPLNSQTETDTTDEDNVNKSSRVSRNTSRRSTKTKVSANTTQEDTRDNINKSSKVSINTSRRSIKIEATTGSSQTDYNASNAEDDTVDGEDRISMSSRFSKSLRVSAPFNSQTETDTTDEDNVNRSSRVSRNTSRRSTKTSANTTQEDSIDATDNINKSSKVSINTSRRSIKIEATTGSSQTDDNASNAEDDTVDGEDRISMSSRFSRSLRVSAPFNSQTETDTTDEDHVNKASRFSRNTSRRSTKTKVSANTTQADVRDNINKSSKVSINTSRRSKKIEATTGSSQTEDNTTNAEDDTTDGEDSIMSSLRVSAPFSSQTETDNTDEDNVNKSSRVSRNTSRRSTKTKVSANTTQEDARDNIQSSKVSINTSRRSIKIKATTGSSQPDDNTTDVEDSIMSSLRVSAPFNSQTETDTTDEDNVNKSSRVSRNTSRRSTKTKVSANTTQEDSIDATDNINKSSNVSINTSRRSKKNEATTGSSQTKDYATNAEDDTADGEDRINMSSRFSRSLRVDAPFNSQTETTDEENVNKSSRVSRNSSRRSKIKANTFQTDDNIDAKDINNSSRVSRNVSRQRGKMDASTDSSQTDYNTTDVQDNRRSESVSRLLTDDDSINEKESLDKSTSVVQDVPTYRLDQSSRSTGPHKSQSSIDSAEMTMDMQQKSRYEADITNSTKNKSRQGLSLYDETTQEAKQPNTSASKNKSLQRDGIFDESTREAFPQFTKVKSVKPISILDDTQEVLSPVRPLSPSKSIRNIQNNEGSVSPSTRVSSIRRSRTKSRTLQDSSLTSTSMDQSSGSVISVSSQSFSSFKKGSSGKEQSRDETEIDVVNISSDTEVKRSFKDSSVKEVLDKSNTSRSSRRQPRTSEMFKDISCTSTPFHKNNSSKEKSRESETSDNKNVTKHDASQLLIKISSNSELFFASTCEENGSAVSSSKRTRSSSNIFEETGTVGRRRSNRSSVSKLGGEHDCVSCRNSSMKRSRSLSLSAAGESSKPPRSSKSARKSSGILHKPIYEDHSPVKRISSAASSKVTTPLLHRISQVTSLSGKTPEKCAETEDETPKSSIKPARRSSKSNQSAYHPTVEDITPVTPGKLSTSGFTEDVFKTPINTPGLFENIRKSVIRSRKRHRESTGSVMKDPKRPRVDFAQEEQQLETSTGSTGVQQEYHQKSPLNRLSNFEGVKKLMRTPSKSPKNDLRNVPNLRNLVSPKKQGTPKNDLTNVAGVKKMFSTPKDVKSPKNDLSSPVGIKRLLKTPTVQKEPIDDLGNVTGVASMFNVSGVEVLHQGSDIENSEDLFTQLTGKRPVRAYPRGKSLSPNKDDTQDQQAHFRKTMGDIPICSPRVQQWVEDHANVNYVTTETAPGLPLSEDDDVFFNVSEKPARKSKSGRSVSPKKLVRDMNNRRKTQGDALRDDPNVTAWKEEQTLQAKTRKLSIGRNSNIKPEIIDSPVTLETATTKAEKVTPRQLKEETLTPKTQQMVSVVESATPASVRARRGRPRQVDKDQQEAKVDKTSIIAAKDDSEETQKEIENKPITRGRRAKRIMSDQDILTSTTASPIQEAKKPRTRRGGSKTDSVDPEVDKVIPKTRSRRGKIDSVSESDSVDEAKLDKSASRRLQKTTDAIQAAPEVSASPARRGGRRRKLIQEDKGENKVFEETAEICSSVSDKSTSRSRRGKIDSVSDDVGTNVAATTILKSKRVQKPSESDSVDEAELNKPDSRRLQKKTDAMQATPEVSASPARRGGRRGKLIEEDKGEYKVFSETAEISPTVTDKPTSRSRRGKKNYELVLQEPIAEAEIKKPAFKGRRGKKEEPQTDEINVDHKVTQHINLEVKEPSSRGRKVKNMEDEEAARNANVEIEKPVGKKSTRTRSAKQCKDEAMQIEEYVKINGNSKGTQKEKEEIVKKPPRGLKAKKAEEEAAQIEETDIGNMDTQSGDEVEVIKPTKARKGKKMLREEVPESNDDDKIEEPVLAKTIRSKRGRKGDNKQDAKEKDSQTQVKEVFERKPKGREIEEELSESDVEFQYSARNTRSRSVKGKIQVSSAEMAKTVTSTARKGRKQAVQNKNESVPSPPAAKAVRGRRGANFVEEVQSEVVEEKKVTLKGVSKRKVHFEDNQDAEKDIPAPTRKSKRTRK